MSSACFKVVCYTVCLGTCTGSITWKKGIIEDIQYRNQYENLMSLSLSKSDVDSEI